MKLYFMFYRFIMSSAMLGIQIGIGVLESEQKYGAKYMKYI